MRTTLSTLLLSAILLVGCADDSSFLTSPETQISLESNLIKLPTDLGQGFSVETVYSAEKIIKGNNGGMLKTESFQLNIHANWFKVLDAEIVTTTDVTPNVRYNLIR